MGNYVDEDYEDYDITQDDDWGEDEDTDDDYSVIEHVVMPDNTDFIRICASYGITDWKSVAEDNKIKKPNDIVAGQKLFISIGDDIDG